MFLMSLSFKMGDFGQSLVPAAFLQEVYCTGKGNNQEQRSGRTWCWALNNRVDGLKFKYHHAVLRVPFRVFGCQFSLNFGFP